MLSITKFSVGLVGQGYLRHAMVLDQYRYHQDLLVFKNTYDDPAGGQPKHFEISRSSPDAPHELYFVHIEVRDMKNLPSQRERAENKKKIFKEKFGDLLNS